jgi:hypothetical protein
MSLTDRLLQIANLILLALCLIALEFYSCRVKNLEKHINAESSAIRYEIKETEERCRRLSYTCIDIMNRKVLEGGTYDGD